MKIVGINFIDIIDNKSSLSKKMQEYLFSNKKIHTCGTRTSRRSPLPALRAITVVLDLANYSAKTVEYRITDRGARRW
jgi:hypothetical protein